MALVCWGSLIPAPHVHPGIALADKFVHLAAYAWLGLLPRLGFAARRTGQRASLAMIGLGAALEFAQLLQPTRDFELLDMAANAVGVLLGLWIAARLSPRS